MQRKQVLYIVAILALLVSMLPVAAVAQEAPPAGQGFSIEEIAAPDDKTEGQPEGLQTVPFAPDGMSFFNETEPNDSAATANALPGSQVVVLATISPATEVDFFSFTASAGDRVYAATQTQWSNGGSTDTEVSIFESDGTTLLQFDDDRGSFSSLSSVIGGAIIPADGTYYVMVDGASTTSTISPYHLHLRVQSGTPTPEVEPNNDLATATPLAASGWMTGTMLATTDPDFFSFSLNAGDSVFLGLDMDPGRLASNTNWNGRLGLGVFSNTLLVANDGSTTKPHAEALFMTVQQSGTYYAYVDSTSATGLGANARYNLSVSIYPKATQNNCTTFTSTDVPVTIGPGVGTVTSTLVVPNTVTSAIQDINATIVLTHSIMADLEVTLVGPTAASTPLFTDVGATATGGQTQMDLGLDDQAALPIGTYTVVSGMVNQPEQPGRLATFNGTPAGGTWTLQLADDLANTSGGRLQGWSLEICGDPPPDYAIELNKTVGTVPAVCATTDSVTVPPGGFDVYYCYTVRNTGLNTLNVHDLVDSELGTIFTGVNYALAPGATYSHIQPAMVYDTVTNTGTWTAYNPPLEGGPTASDSDTATVNVRSYCPAGFDEVTLDYSFFDNPFPPAGWTVTNTSAGCAATGVPEWTNTNPANRANLTGGVGPFAIADSDRCGSGSTLDTIMTTGLLDFTGLISPTVSFNTDYNDIATGGDQGLLDVSTDGGANWANLFTWDEDHRGPLLVDQALTGAAGDNDVQVRWHYAQGTYDWWWEVDDAFITACEPIPSNPAISLDKTVGTDPNVCATTDEINLPAGGGDVTYCYEVTNTGDVSFNTHDLDDSELGNIFSGLNYLLTPGASAFVTETANIAVTTVNTGTWTAYNQFEGGGVTASDTATVTVDLPAPAIALDKTVGTDPNVCATTDEITLPAGGGDVAYCYEVTNTGDVTLNLHDLDDSELGNIFSGLNYALLPGASAFVTATTNIAVTTVNTATWTAYNPQEPSVQATDTATVTVESNPPNIFVDPLSMDSTQPPDVQVQQTLTISNTGGGTLDWEIWEEPTGAPAAPLNQPPAGLPHPQVDIMAEMTGLDNLAPTASGERSSAAAARARRALLTTGLLLVPDSTNDRVMAFDPVTGNLLDADFIPADPTNLSTPKNAILSAGGDSILVADQIDDVVQEYDLDGNYLGVFAPAGGVNTAILDNITGIDLRPNGNLLVAVQSGTNADSVAEFDTSGNYLGNFVANAAGGLDGPFDVYPRTADWLVPSINTDNVLSFDLSGAPLGVFAGSVAFGEQVAEAGNANVLVANFSTPNSGVMEFTPAGTFIAVHSAVTGNRGVYELPNGNILTSNGSGLHEIDRLGNLIQTKYSGTGGQYIEYVAPPAGCTNLADISWLSTSPVSGATSSGGGQDVDVTFDSTGLAAGTYTGNLCVESNDPDAGPGNETDLVIVPVTLTVETPPEPPNIFVDPLSMASSQPTDVQVNQTLVISNTGGGTLNWVIDEDVTSGPELVDWSDNFDSYATGANLHGMGGWKGWNNDPTFTAFTTNVQARSAPNSVDIAGSSDLVHEYSGYTSGQWTYTAWQYIPGNMTGLSYFIMLNQYDDAQITDNWSVQVSFDSGTGVMTNEGVSGGAMPYLSDQWVEIRLEIDLDADTQSFFYNNVLLYTGTWSGEVSGGGIAAIGAVDLFANGASSVYYDDMSLTEVGAPVACDAPSDIPWLSLDVTNGANAGGTDTDVTVTFDSTGLTPDVYTGSLCVTSNDPDPGPGNETDLVVVPVTLTVLPPTAVALTGLAADAAQSPAPLAGLPLAALPAAVAAALGAAFIWRRQRD